MQSLYQYGSPKSSGRRTALPSYVRLRRCVLGDFDDEAGNPIPSIVSGGGRAWRLYRLGLLGRFDLLKPRRRQKGARTGVAELMHVAPVPVSGATGERVRARMHYLRTSKRLIRYIKPFP